MPIQATTHYQELFHNLVVQAPRLPSRNRSVESLNQTQLNQTAQSNTADAPLSQLETAGEAPAPQITICKPHPAEKPYAIQTISQTPTQEKEPTTWPRHSAARKDRYGVISPLRRLPNGSSAAGSL